MSSSHRVAGRALFGLSTAAAMAALAPAVTRAQDATAAAATTAATTTDETSDLGKVVVQAPSRLAPLQNVPESISVVTGDDLAQQDSLDLGSITRRLSNTTWNPGNSREFSLSIRGIGKQSNTEAEDPDVLVNVDGVSFAYNPLASFDLTDVDTVQLVRGPQGTTGGKASPVGAVNVTTKAPSFTPGFDYSVAVGEYNRVIANAAGGGPLINDVLAWRASVLVDRADGAYKNLYNTSQTYGNIDKVIGRLQLLFTPTENFSARIIAEIDPTTDNYYNDLTFYTQTPAIYGNGAPNPLSTDASHRLARSWFLQEHNYSYPANYLGAGAQGAVDNNTQAPLITTSRGFTGLLNWNIGDLTLASITGYHNYDFKASNDEGTPFDITRAGGGEVHYEQFTQELRLSGSASRVDYQTGLFYLRSGNYGALVTSDTSWGSDAGAWFANDAQYRALTADNTGRVLLLNSLDNMVKTGYQFVQNEDAAFYANADWHVAKALTVTAGARLTYEHRRSQDSALITDNGYGSLLGPVSVNGVALGGLATNAAGALTPAALANPAQLGAANAAAQQYFNTAAYSSLTSAQQAQFASAQALRAAQIGKLWNLTNSKPLYALQPTFVFSPSYKITPEVTGYLSYQHGEKAGISQNVNGLAYNVEPEKSNAYEIGVKSDLFHKTLVFNADIFVDDINNYQQAVYVFDAYTTALNNNGQSFFTSATGNAAKVRSQGLEVDLAYSGIDHLTVRANGAIDKAYYRSFPNLGQPAENANQTATPYRDVTGQTLPGASKYSGNVGAEYRIRVFESKEFHASFNTTYTSRFNSDVTLSRYAWIQGQSTTDAAIGVGRQDEKVDLSLIVKNAFDNRTPTAITWNTITPPTQLRWYGLQLSGKL
jgi:iron complex outermembrane recepter protein